MTHIANRIIRKNLGKSMIYFNTPPVQLEIEAEQAFNEQKKYTKPETFFLTPREQEQGPPGKRRLKYWEDTIRHYDQKQVGFFVCQVLAKRKIAIPLR